RQGPGQGPGRWLAGARRSRVRAPAARSVGLLAQERRDVEALDAAVLEGADMVGRVAARAAPDGRLVVLVVAAGRADRAVRIVGAGALHQDGLDRRSRADAGRHHGHPQRVVHVLVEHRAVDDRRVLGAEGLDRVDHLAGLAQLEAAARGDVHDHAAGAVEVDAVEQWRGDGLLGRETGAIEAGGLADAHHGLAL